MTFKFFTNPKTFEELRKQYKALAMQHHPDRGGSTADMQTINNEYDNSLQSSKTSTPQPISKRKQRLNKMQNTTKLSKILFPALFTLRVSRLKLLAHGFG